MILKLTLARGSWAASFAPDLSLFFFFCFFFFFLAPVSPFSLWIIRTQLTWTDNNERFMSTLHCLLWLMQTKVQWSITISDTARSNLGCQPIASIEQYLDAGLSWHIINMKVKIAFKIGFFKKRKYTHWRVYI